MPQGLLESRPGVRLALAATIEPFEEHPACQMHIPMAALCVIRNGIVVQMPLHPHLGPSQQFARREQVAVSSYPICKPRERLPQFLARSFPLDLERAMTGSCT